MFSRREFFATLLVAPAITEPTVTANQFDVSGLLERTGLEGEGYYAISQHFALMINPQKLPALYQQAEKLVGSQARVILERA
jgi:hypothetical protein